MTQALYALLSVAFVGCIFLLQSSGSSRLWVEAGAQQRWISWAILCIYLSVSILDLQTRDMRALASVGLSLQNKVEIAITLSASVWAAILLLTQRVSLHHLVNNPNYWLLWLLLTYLLSSLWSTWPTLTVFRVLEAGSFWILAAHIFARRNWFRQVEAFLWLAFTLHLLRGCLVMAGYVEGETAQDSLIGLMRSNSASLVTGLLIIWTWHRCITEYWPVHAIKLPLLFLALLLFGSLATSLALRATICILIVLHVDFRRRIFLSSLLVAGFLIAANVTLLATGDVIHTAIVALSQAFSKPIEHITGMTGRLELWSTIWDSTRDHPWGFGFAALERTFSLRSTSLSWTAGNAHNGFISAWLGAGLTSVALLVTFFGALVFHALRTGGRVVPLLISLILLVFVNNLSLPAVGGRLTVAFLFVMALTHVPIIHPRSIQPFTLREAVKHG